MLNASWILIGQPKNKNPFMASQSDFMVLFSPLFSHWFTCFKASSIENYEVPSSLGRGVM